MHLGFLNPSSRSIIINTLSRRKQCFGPYCTTVKITTRNRNRNISTMCNKPGENSTTDKRLDIDAAAAKFGWGDVAKPARDYSKDRIMELPLSSIKRPLQRLRQNNQEKVQVLMQSIQDIGQQEPIDILEVDGQYYGFSGCHRWEATYRLGREKIKCRIIKATPQVLKMHMM